MRPLRRNSRLILHDLPYCGFKLIKQQPPATPGSLYGIDDETFYKATQGRGVRLCDTASHIKAVKTRLQNGW